MVRINAMHTFMSLQNPVIIRCNMYGKYNDNETYSKTKQKLK